jgi:mannose-1-phosphate guanylyltransferase/mannose-6-phosphate isomerase
MPDAVCAVVLAGGSGTRLWPTSTDARPKPFLALSGGKSLLVETFDRAARLAGARNVFVSGRRSHADLIRHELPGLPESRMILEPARRNTAPAVALAALVVSEEGDGVMAVLPSDQAVRDEAAFDAALRTAAEAARTHAAFVTLGIPPTRPETGYGYMEISEENHERLSSNGKEVAARVVRFVEKPPREAAERYAKDGRHLWNAGIFVFRVSLLFEEMKRTCPDVLDAARRAHAARQAGDLSSFAEIFSSSPSVSIDVAVMEKASSVLTVPCACGWSDLGSWDAVLDFRAKSPGANVIEGRAEVRDGRDNLVLAGDRPVRVIGLSGIAVVDAPEGLLVMRRGASDELRKSVEESLAVRP